MILNANILESVNRIFSLLYKCFGFWGVCLLCVFALLGVVWILVLIDYCINDPHGDLRPPQKD
jgi:hypothetical protein